MDNEINIVAMETAQFNCNLDDPDGRKAAQRYLKSLDMALALWDIREKLFRLSDNGHENPEVDKQNEANVEMINDILYSHGIILDDLIE